LQIRLKHLRQDKRQQQKVGRGFHSGAAVFLIGLNLAVFVFTHYTQAGAAFFQRMIFYPGNLLTGNLWPILVSGFFHSSWSHLGWNMLAVFVFGRIVQEGLGVRTTLFIYFGALILSMLFSLVIYVGVLHQNVAVIGASGAVMGLMSAAMLIAPFSITWEMVLPIPTMVKGWLFFAADLRGFLGGEQDGVSHLAHLCGFASVMILVYFLSSHERQKMTAGFLINLVSLALVVWLKKTVFPA